MFYTAWLYYECHYQLFCSICNETCSLVVNYDPTMITQQFLFAKFHGPLHVTLCGEGLQERFLTEISLNFHENQND